MLLPVACQGGHLAGAGCAARSGIYKWFAYADDFVIGFEHHRPTASRRSVRTVPAGANVVAVGVVAAAAVSPRRSSADRSRADRRRTDTVAPIPAAIAVTPIACAAHCDSAAAPRSSNCDSAAAVGSATAPIAATSATASIGVVGNEGD
jgi:hypothetical protein